MFGFGGGGKRRGAIRVGERVYLRRPRRRDADELVALVRSSQGQLHPWASPPADREAFLRYVKRARSPRFEPFFVRRLDDEALVGVVNVSEIVLGGFLSAYLGYYSGAELAGNGYMTEGLTLVIEHCFEQLGLHRLEANIQPGNDRSLALVKRLGFEKEGFSPGYLKVCGKWRDHERWAILVDRWEERRGE